MFSKATGFIQVQVNIIQPFTKVTIDLITKVTVTISITKVILRLAIMRMVSAGSSR
jgi:hypothetical protein